MGKLGWAAFVFFGLFTVASLNAIRAYISQSADNHGSVYGIFYAGVALFGALGAYISGLIWEFSACIAHCSSRLWELHC